MNVTPLTVGKWFPMLCFILAKDSTLLQVPRARFGITSGPIFIGTSNESVGVNVTPLTYNGVQTGTKSEYVPYDLPRYARRFWFLLVRDPPPGGFPFCISPGYRGKVTSTSLLFPKPGSEFVLVLLLRKQKSTPLQICHQIYDEVEKLNQNGIYDHSKQNGIYDHSRRGGGGWWVASYGRYGTR